jgi:hypothetical protein
LHAPFENECLNPRFTLGSLLSLAPYIVSNGGDAFTFTQPTDFDDFTLPRLEAGTKQYFIVGSLQYRDYLDRTSEHSFVGVLDKKRMNLCNTDNTGQGAISPFIQTAAGRETDSYTYTRPVGPAA